jgi:hypothetical protein
VLGRLQRLEARPRRGPATANDIAPVVVLNIAGGELRVTTATGGAIAPVVVLNIAGGELRVTNAQGGGGLPPRPAA